MANRNYQIGRQFEYKTIAYLRKNGYYCLRAYGSKGLYDIIAIPRVDPNNKDFHNYPLMIQCKRNGYIHPKELQHIKDEHKWQGFALIASNVKGKGRPLFKSLSGEIITTI